MSTAPKQILWIGARQPLIELANQSTQDLNVVNLHAATSEEIHAVIEGSVINLIVINTAPSALSRFSESTIKSLSTIPVLVSTDWITSSWVRRLRADMFRDPEDLKVRISKLLTTDHRRMSNEKEFLIERIACRAGVRTEEGAWEQPQIARKLERRFKLNSPLESQVRVGWAIFFGAFEEPISRRKILRNIIGDTEAAFCTELRTALIERRKYDLGSWMSFALNVSGPQHLGVFLQPFAGPLKCEPIEIEQHSNATLSAFLERVGIGINWEVRQIASRQDNKFIHSTFQESTVNKSRQKAMLTNFVLSRGAAMLARMAQAHLNIGRQAHVPGQRDQVAATDIGLKMSSLAYVSLVSWLLAVGICLKEYGRYEMKWVGDLRQVNQRIDFFPDPTWLRLISANLTFARSATTGE